ncbi:bifunctional protein FolD [Insulibacter thermoxylanivorax]|uniref:Bifunctional protein FolD n=1 Tax=Insulibacter thermoxylanivorax TaxID=2749268 RepID=A0A916VEY3_9BACL|nr:bifunctional methylenetetrahydrofolate dehydrogenase/methenyltetrahydrofolate cyclohydrolase FolD [Insulibacter thermoxylanivorax]GFR36786.1 bifunctional protein FolD [Insulibacter thermoxylanivorax]
MSGRIIDGKHIASIIRESIKQETEKLIEERGIQPGLAVVLVGEDPASQVYVRNKERACQKVGMYSEVHRLPEHTSQSELIQLIERLGRDERIHGILVQLPLPAHIDEKAVIAAIPPAKDVDGFHPVSVGNMVIGDEAFLPCTPAGIIELIKRTGIELAGKHAVVVGRSNIVGKPVSMLLLHEHATVTMCHSRTPDLAAMTRQADVLVVAVGRPEMIKAEHVKPGAVVIDVGVNRLPDGRLVGDVDYDEVAAIAEAITPVPGGVGPMTITMLLKNTLQAALRI